MSQTLGWYPGHMARAMQHLKEDLQVIDVVIETIDARIPHAGTNPELERLAARRTRLRVLTREDLADPQKTQAWSERFRHAGHPTVAIDAKVRAGAARLRAALSALPLERRSARAIVIGIPNAGKSTVINALVGRKVAHTENRPGVTRARQWFRIAPNLELMDTPGILVPKIDSVEAQWKLALVGGLPQARFDAEEVVANFHRWAEEALGPGKVPNLETFAQSRGLVRRGNLLDTHNAARAYLKEFNDGRFGRVTLEDPLL